MNKREIGDNYELLAADYLRNNGVKILVKNYRNRFGEIDLIGYDGETLVFFEVKYRNNLQSGYAEEAVDAKLMVIKKDSFAPAAEAVEEGL